MYTWLANTSKQEVLRALLAMANNKANEATSSIVTPIIMHVVLHCILYKTYGSVNTNNLVGRVTVFLMILVYGATASAARQLMITHDTMHGCRGVPLFPKYKN